MAKFKKGESGNVNGRPPGSKNLITSELRETLKFIIADEIEKIPAMLLEIETKDRLELTLKLMAFIMPKLERVSPRYGETRPPQPTMKEMFAEMEM